MDDTGFFKPSVSLSVGEICRLTGGEVSEQTAHGLDHTGLTISRIAPLDRAQEGDLSFLDNPKYLAQAEVTKASVVICSPKYASRLASASSKYILIKSQEPYRSAATIAATLFPQAMRPETLVQKTTGIHSSAHVAKTAKLEADVIVDANAVVGEGVHIGSGSRIGVGAVIGEGVHIGRECSIGAHCVLQYALLGNEVIVHPGVKIGQDGFGFAPGANGLQKVPQTGRVILQDRIEVGANTTIDRGTNRDTIIGEGTKIDNLVQIAHNVEIGCHCVIVSQVGIAGSSKIDDFVMIGGHAGLNGHIRDGAGAKIAGCSAVQKDVEPGSAVAGMPARPVRQFIKIIGFLDKISTSKVDPEAKGQ